MLKISFKVSTLKNISKHYSALSILFAFMEDF